MCVTSMISDHYNVKWKEIPNYFSPYPALPNGPCDSISYEPNPIKRTEFEELKKQVLEMKELLTKALEYDKRTNQIECSNEEKLDRLEEVARLSGIDCSELFKKLRGAHKKKKLTRIKRKSIIIKDK